MSGGLVLGSGSRSWWSRSRCGGLWAISHAFFTRHGGAWRLRVGEGALAAEGGLRESQWLAWRLSSSQPLLTQASRGLAHPQVNKAPLPRPPHPPRAACPVHAVTARFKSSSAPPSPKLPSPLATSAMASDMPIPVPPRTPTPPPEDQQPPVGLGLPDTQLDRDALSPMSATFPPQQLGSLSPSSANLSPRTPNSAYYTPQMSVNSEASTPKTASSDAPQNPFNFKPQQYVVGKPPAKSVRLGAASMVARNHPANAFSRTLAGAADTSTSTAASRTRSSSNRRRVHLSKSPRRCLCPIGPRLGAA